MRYKRPTQPTEADVQAEFYRRCRNANIECHLEYRVEKPNCRFDAVIVRGDTIVAIIEVKRRRTKDGFRGGEEAREEDQRRRYACWGPPVIFVHGLEEIESAFAQVRKIIAARSGGGWRRDSTTPFAAVRSVKG